jgi:hypothetical protein
MRPLLSSLSRTLLPLSACASLALSLGLSLGILTGNVAGAQEPGQAGTPASFPASSEDPAAEAQRDLQKYEAEIKKVIDPINALNPFYTGPKPTVGPSGAPDSAMSEQAAKALAFMEQVRKWLEHPFVRSVLKVLNDQKFSEGLAKIWASPMRELWAYAEGGGVLALWFLGAYRRGRAQTFLRRIWVSLSQAILSILILGVALPWATLGNAWLDVLGGLSRAAASAVGIGAPAAAFKTEEGTPRKQ